MELILIIGLCVGIIYGVQGILKFNSKRFDGTLKEYDESLKQYKRKNK